MTIYESSSGNTAKALAMLSAERGYEFVAIVDKHAPSDKLNSILAYGGKLHFCAEKEGDEGGHLVDVRRNTAKKLAEENNGNFSENLLRCVLLITKNLTFLFTKRSCHVASSLSFHYFITITIRIQ